MPTPGIHSAARAGNQSKRSRFGGSFFDAHRRGEAVQHAALGPTVNQLHRSPHRRFALDARCRAKPTSENDAYREVIARQPTAISRLSNIA
jgi:hypothetical protein